MAEKLVDIPKFTQLSSRVWRVLGLNPGKTTLQGTNTYLIGAGHQKILLDCGDGLNEYSTLLETSLKSIHPNAYISDILISHGHEDHWGGLRNILSSSRLNPFKNIKVHKYPVPPGCKVVHLNRFPPEINPFPLTHNQIFKAEDVTLKVIYTPGHCKDHCTFWLEEERNMFTADCVLGQGTSLFEDLYEYIEGLTHLLTFDPQHLYPGHGPVIEQGISKIKEYIKHRTDRENEIIAIISKGTKTWSPLEISTLIYPDSPESLKYPAAMGVAIHLMKLAKEEKASPEKYLPFDYDNYLNIVNTQWKWTPLKNSL
ncbi:beta-lactamase-like protein [Pilobolus umbonatus]|nr:beta-lactamase-like protein [Pilobolus umbonatus]